MACLSLSFFACTSTTFLGVGDHFWRLFFVPVSAKRSILTRPRGSPGWDGLEKEGSVDDIVVESGFRKRSHL